MAQKINTLLSEVDERVMLFHKQRSKQMAKSQVRGNKEARKPKKEKVADKPAPTLGSQVKNSESTLRKK
jgi:hypothetical protein